MTSRDYILRMIEQFGQVVLAVRRMIFGGGAGSPEAEERLKGLASQAGLDLELARAATPETLMLFAAPSGEIEPARCWMYAETLLLDGIDATLASDVFRARSSLRKAEMLFGLLAPAGAFLVGFPEAAERLEEIRTRLAELDAGEGRSDAPRGRRRSAARAGPSPSVAVPAAE